MDNHSKQQLEKKPTNTEAKNRRPHISPPHKRRKIHSSNNTNLVIPPTLPRAALPHKSEDVIRLMIQSMEEMGLSASANQLREESGICEETEEISKFKEHLLKGHWDKVLEFIPILCVESPFRQLLLNWSIHRHRYLEFIEKSDHLNALKIIREQLFPLTESIQSQNNSDQTDYRKIMKQLTTLLILGNQQSMKEIANWPGIENGARDQLLLEIHEFVSPSIMLPPGRLGKLLDQAVIAQRERCIFRHQDHETHDISLLENHSCKRTQIPLQHTVAKPGHTDEVWCLSFSHSGNYLASGGKDPFAILWHSNPSEREMLGTIHKKLYTNDSEGLHKLCWSQDDKSILGCTTRQVLLWTVESGQVVKVFENENARPRTIQSVVWHPDEQSFLCGGLGQYVTQYSLNGQAIKTWEVANVVDIDVHRASRMALAICQQKKINIINLDTQVVEFIQEVARISSVSISTDGQYALVHLFSQDIHLWNIKTKDLITQYHHKRSLEPTHLFITATFGGEHDSFVLSGSIDGNIYMWQRNGNLLEVFKGSHARPVNCVEWNSGSSDPLFASGSDDNEVILWHV